MDASSKPVVLEIFTSVEACSSCRHAEEAALTLRVNYTPDDLHLIVYTLGGPQDNLARARASYYQIDFRNFRNPVAVFNGSSRIVGANAGVLASYRQNVEDRLTKVSADRLSGWMRFSQRYFVATTSYVPAVSSEDMELRLIVVEDTPNVGPGRVRLFRSLPPLFAQQFLGFIPQPVDEARLYAYVMAQRREGDREILLSYRLRNASPISRDLNRDGRLDSLDLFLFATHWRTTSSIADLNRDGIVDALDLLSLIENFR